MVKCIYQYERIQTKTIYQRNCRANMKITLLGNCQTKALTWYIQQLNSNFDVKWVQPEFGRGCAWAQPGIFREKSIPTITGTEDSIQRLKGSSFLIYQPILPATSKNLNFEKIKSYNPECHFISISSFYFHPDTSQKNGLEGMIHRANVFDIDVPAHKLIEKHGSNITIEPSSQNPVHPTAFYLLELVREICTKTGWNYYSDAQYNQYLKEGYPFG